MRADLVALSAAPVPDLISDNGAALGTEST